MNALQCSEEEANKIIKNYEEGFKGTAEFAKKGLQFVKQHGYVLMCPLTGHKMYWWDWEDWKRQQDLYESPDWSWDEYRLNHKNTGDLINQQVKMHFKAVSKWGRMARNGPTQGEQHCPV